MHATRLGAAVLAALCILAGLSCGSRSRLVQGGAEESAEGRPRAGLPALGELPAPSRDLSALAADGFLDLDPLYPLFSANAAPGAGVLTLDNTINVLTYAVYGVGGFDGDNYPVSVKLDLGAGVMEFYVAFSDYQAGAWEVTGPFTGEGEFGIPQLDGYDGADAFVSENRTHYIAVIVPDTHILNIHGLALGVNGGDAAPKPVFGLGGSGSANGYYLSWTPSISFMDPDFAGYIVERAPALSGDFAALAAQPSLETAFKDPDAMVGDIFRYRVASYDVGGNFTRGVVFTGGPAPGEEADPVAVLKLPRGPLYGPVTVTADLSGSYDPEGEGIGASAIQVYNPWLTGVAGPTASLELNPGCHIVSAFVQTADGRFGATFDYIKVLPQWEPASELVRATDPTGTYKDARLSRFRAGVQPSDGLTTLCGQDTAASALTFWHQSGSQMLPYRAPRLEFVGYIGEPVAEGNALVFPVASAEDHYLASFDGSEIGLLALGDHSGYYTIALVKDNAGTLWYLAPDEVGGNEKLFIHEIGGAAVLGDIAGAADGINYLDAVLEPASGHIFAFYDDGSALYYAEFDPAGPLPVGSGPLGVPNFAFLLDAEVNPENGRVGVMYYDVPTDRNCYIEQDGVGGWTAPQTIDNSLDNLPEGDLCPSDAGRLNAFFALDNNQQAHRYILGGGVWTLENTVAYSSDSGHEAALAPVPGSPDMRVADNCGDGVIRLARLKAGNAENVFAGIDSAIGQGLDMHAAAGTDGLHLIYGNVHDFDKVTHMLSPGGPDEGEVWNEVNSFTATSGLNLERTAEGEIYATGFMAPNASLYWWDGGGGNFVSEYSAPALGVHRPMLGSGIMDSRLQFGVWDNTLGKMHTLYGKHGAFDPPVDYDLIESPVWEGVFAGGGIPGFYELAGTLQQLPRLTFNSIGTSGYVLLADTAFGGETGPWASPLLAGRLVDGAAYFGGTDLVAGLRQEILVANGALFRPLRLHAGAAGSNDPADIPLGLLGEEMNLQRSVSADTVSGYTALELIATTDGREIWFAWSNYGDFEALPLPPGLDGMTTPLVVCGNDGRWHIIYKDWKTDSTMVRSTI